MFSQCIFKALRWQHFELLLLFGGIRYLLKHLVFKITFKNTCSFRILILFVMQVFGWIFVYESIFPNSCHLDHCMKYTLIDILCNCSDLLENSLICNQRKKQRVEFQNKVYWCFFVFKMHIWVPCHLIYYFNSLSDLKANYYY